MAERDGNQSWKGAVGRDGSQSRKGAPAVHFPSIDIDERTAKILWRDSLFLVLGAIALLLISFVETHAPDANYRHFRPSDEAKFDTTNPLGIVDTGFMLTEPLYRFLAENRGWNDLFAAINSFALVIPSVYVAYVTVWVGDYSLVFRVLFTQLLRSFCGWFTYLPPDPNYLPSYYDFPDIVHCLYLECSGAPKVLPFVSFFSGHVCTMLVAGNHMWLHRYKRLAIIVHSLDAFQVVRLLATRGHYSIDIIIGWYMAVNVSNYAGRLGRHYSRGTSIQEIMPSNARDAFETVTGVYDVRREEQMSMMMREEEVLDLLQKLHPNDEEYSDQSFLDRQGAMQTETTLKMIHTHVKATARSIEEKIQRYQMLGRDKEKDKGE